MSHHFGSNAVGSLKPGKIRIFLDGNSMSYGDFHESLRMLLIKTSMKTKDGKSHFEEFLEQGVNEGLYSIAMNGGYIVGHPNSRLPADRRIGWVLGSCNQQHYGFVDNKLAPIALPTISIWLERQETWRKGFLGRGEKVIDWRGFGEFGLRPCIRLASDVPGAHFDGNFVEVDACYYTSRTSAKFSDFPEQTREIFLSILQTAVASVFASK